MTVSLRVACQVVVAALMVVGLGSQAHAQAHGVENHVDDALDASRMMDAVAANTEPEYRSAQLCPSWDAQKSTKGWQCDPSFGWNKAKLIKPKCPKDDPGCDKTPYCLQEGKVKSWVVLEDEESGKMWNDKSALTYTCKDGRLEGALKHKIYDAEKRILKSKTTWIVNARFSKGEPVGLSTRKINGKQLVLAICSSPKAVAQGEGKWRTDWLWTVELEWPDPKDSHYEEEKDQLKKDQAAFKAGTKALAGFSKLCSKFVPDHCAVAKEKKLDRTECRDAAWCTKNPEHCPAFKAK